MLKYKTFDIHTTLLDKLYQQAKSLHIPIEKFNFEYSDTIQRIFCDIIQNVAYVIIIGESTVIWYYSPSKQKWISSTKGEYVYHDSLGICVNSDRCALNFFGDGYCKQISGCKFSENLSYSGGFFRHSTAAFHQNKDGYTKSNFQVNRFAFSFADAKYVYICSDKVGSKELQLTRDIPKIKWRILDRKTGNSINTLDAPYIKLVHYYENKGSLLQVYNETYEKSYFIFERYRDVEKLVIPYWIDDYLVFKYYCGDAVVYSEYNVNKLAEITSEYKEYLEFLLLVFRKIKCVIPKVLLLHMIFPYVLTYQPLQAF